MKLYYNQLNEILSKSSDILLIIGITSSVWEIKDCISLGGYNTQYEYCKHDLYWNTSLWRYPDDGSIEAYVDFSPYNLISDKYWIFCVSNGWQGSETPVHYELSVVFYNSDIVVTGYAPGFSPTQTPTFSPTPINNPRPSFAPTSTSSPTHYYPIDDQEKYIQIDPKISCNNNNNNLNNINNNLQLSYKLQLSSEEMNCTSFSTIQPIQLLEFSVIKLSTANNIYSSISDLSLLITERFSSTTFQYGGNYQLNSILDGDDNDDSTNFHFFNWPIN